MSVLYLRESEVRELLDMEMAIEVIEQAFLRMAENSAVNVPRHRAQGKGIYLHTMSAAADYLGLIGWKAYTTTANGAKFLLGLYDQTSGEMLALIEADYLGQMRTGATSGVATEYLARPDSKVIGVFGTGVQARTQLKAVCTVIKPEVVEVYSRNEARRQKFADEMSEYCNVQIIPVHAPEDCAAEKDIVICATNSAAPLFDGRVLDEGTHLNVIGSNFRSKTELDMTTVQRADLIVCDSISQCMLEAGDFTEALEKGATDWRLMQELKDVVSGRGRVRASTEQITLFKSVGLAIEDVALGGEVLQMAKEQGLGMQLPF